MDEITDFFSGLSRSRKVLIILVPALAVAYVFALYFLLSFPRAVAAGMLSLEQQEECFAEAPFLFIVCWVAGVIAAVMSLLNLMDGKCEDLETLSVEGARWNLRVKLGQLIGCMLIYLLMCLLPVPVEVTFIIVFGSLWVFAGVTCAAVHRACVLELVKERDREM